MAIIREFFIDGNHYCVSNERLEYGSVVTIKLHIGNGNAISDFSVQFPVSSEDAAISFVTNATDDDIKRGITKMADFEPIAKKINQLLMNSRISDSTTDYSKYQPKYLKR